MEAADTDSQQSREPNKSENSQEEVREPEDYPCRSSVAHSTGEPSKSIERALNSFQIRNNSPKTHRQSRLFEQNLFDPALFQFSEELLRAERKSSKPGPKSFLFFRFEVAVSRHRDDLEKHPLLVRPHDLHMLPVRVSFEKCAFEKMPSGKSARVDPNSRSIRLGFTHSDGVRLDLKIASFDLSGNEAPHIDVSGAQFLSEFPESTSAHEHDDTVDDRDNCDRDDPAGVELLAQSTPT